MKENIDKTTKRFLEQLEERNISGYKLMKDGVIKSQSSLTNIKIGKQGATRRVIDKCVELYNLDRLYILLGTRTGNISNNSGQILISGDNSHVTNSNNNGGTQTVSNTANPIKSYIKEELVNVPFVLQDAAASFVECFGDMQNCKTETYGIMQEKGEDLANGDYVVFQVNGDSMTPNIPDSAKVLARKISEPKWEEAVGVVFVAYGKTLTIKRVLKNTLYSNNTLTLKADNPIYGQIDISRNEIRGMWRAERIVSQKIR